MSDVVFAWIGRAVVYSGGLALLALLLGVCSFIVTRCTTNFARSMGLLYEFVSWKSKRKRAEKAQSKPRSR